MFKELFGSANKELRNKFFFTLLALFIFIIGTNIQVPGTQKILTGAGFLDLMNLMSGGALKNFSILALGVMPYITASIVMQLAEQTELFPGLTELGKQGEIGRRKINTYTRYLGILLAFIQGYGTALMLDRQYGILLQAQTASNYLYVALILTGGTAFVLWLSDQITQKGLGNGVSMIIMAGIVSGLPTTFIDVFKTLVADSSNAVGVIAYILFILLYILIIIGVIYFEQSLRRIPIQYSNITRAAYGAVNNFIPLKLNSAGVMPVILAGVMLSAPLTIISFFGKEEFVNTIMKYLDSRTSPGIFIYIGLIILFSYIYTFMQLKPEEFAKNLQKQNGYIPGVRPGIETEEYFSKVLKRLTFVGSLFLAFIAILPTIFSRLTNLPSTADIGGTGLLIVVGVALEFYKQIEGQVAASRSYDLYR